MIEQELDLHRVAFGREVMQHRRPVPVHVIRIRAVLQQQGRDASIRDSTFAASPNCIVSAVAEKESHEVHVSFAHGEMNRRRVVELMERERRVTLDEAMHLFGIAGSGRREDAVDLVARGDVAIK